MAPPSFLISEGVFTQLDVFVSKFPSFCNSRYCSSVRSSMPMAIWKDAGSGSVFCELARSFFAAFTDRQIKYYIERSAASEKCKFYYRIAPVFDTDFILCTSERNPLKLEWIALFISHCISILGRPSSIFLIRL